MSAFHDETDYVYQPITDEQWDLMPDEMRELAREVRPWDFVRPGTPRAHKDVAAARYAMCKACPLFNKTLRACTQCGCLMKLKVHLADAYCPDGQWGAVSQEGTLA